MLFRVILEFIKSLKMTILRRARLRVVSLRKSHECSRILTGHYLVRRLERAVLQCSDFDYSG